jgi:hypothetical protein
MHILMLRLLEGDMFIFETEYNSMVTLEISKNAPDKKIRIFRRRRGPR